MQLSDVKRLIRHGENATIEFKAKMRHPEKVVKELVAFANTAGGHLFIGVHDDGSLAGVKYPEDEIFALDRAIEKYCKPAFEYTVHIIDLTEDSSVVVYEVPASDNKAHCVVNNELLHGRQAFVRVADRSIKASKHVKEILDRQSKNKSIQFNFGDKEKLLMTYLENNETITVNEFKKISGRNYYQASRTLILMVLANVLEIHPHEKEDFYTLKGVGLG
ncbi:AlbA family DNA-binding domain-containing protein [Fulvivirga ligni]|uniref:AlbA family DNA-binding domain-containing protein n=1 Tax=Fulvivirga ligni TaxID=2904246 RepID=UPI001F22FB60|nr:ATP-binding protein [Fulvivirga ligni]UII21442.1 ATP-binding protein [Fulvivirga ligni]